MDTKFIGQEIKVTLNQLRLPEAFTLEGTEHRVAEILEAWHDHGFGRAAGGRPRWWQRHHRNYYRVKTAGGEVFEIYHDRGTSLEQARKGKWFATRKL